MASASVLWVGALVLVAAVGQAVVVQRVPRPPAPAASANPTEVVAVPSTTADVHTPTAPLPGGAPSPSAGDPTTDRDTMSPPAPPVDADLDLGISEPLPPGSPADSLIPPFPGLELPDLPPELDAILMAASPSMRQACALTGIAVVAAGLVRGDLENAGVPVQNLLTYLAPVFSACAVFPEDEPSACAFSAALNTALIPPELALVVGIPDLGGLVIDQIQAVGRVLENTGLDLPEGTDEVVARALGCEAR